MVNLTGFQKNAIINNFNLPAARFSSNLSEEFMIKPNFSFLYLELSIIVFIAFF